MSAQYQPPAPDLDLVEGLLQGKGAEPFDVMEVLHEIQATYRYLPEAALLRVSQTLDVPLIEVFRLANFYKVFSLKPKGKHLLTVCTGTACHVKGAPKFVDEIVAQLGVQPGETTHDGMFTVETVNCVGACALAPVVILDGKYFDHVTPARLRDLLAATRRLDEAGVVDAQA
jgi:NADH:ubiquinone oxidoreductase subunit E